MVKNVNLCTHGVNKMLDEPISKIEKKQIQATEKALGQMFYYVCEGITQIFACLLYVGMFIITPGLIILMILCLCGVSL